MSDYRALPDGHVLKPLEDRMLEMCAEMDYLRVLGGNFVAALRVFADHHPTLGETIQELADAGVYLTSGRIAGRIE